MKKVLSLLICTLLMTTFMTGAYAYDYSVSQREALINDFAELIPYEDEKILNSKLEQISEIHECEVAILTVNSANGIDITEFSDDYYDENGFGYGDNDDGVMLVIDMASREFAITTHGKAIEIFTDYNLSQLENEFIPYLLRNEYTLAFIAFYEKCDRIFTDYKHYSDNFDRDYVHSPDNGSIYNPSDGGIIYYKESFSEKLSRVFSFSWILISLIIGIIIALIYTLYLKSQLKTVRSKKTASDYVVPGSFRITQSRDIFLYSNVKKIPKPKNNTSSGRSGGTSFGGRSSTHTSSSGRTHGGSRGRF